MSGYRNISGDGSENGGNWFSDKDFFETRPEGTEYFDTKKNWWEMAVPKFNAQKNLWEFGVWRKVTRDPSNKVKAFFKGKTLYRQLRGVPRGPGSTNFVTHYAIKLPDKYVHDISGRATYYVPGEDLYPNPDKVHVDSTTTFYWYPPFTKDPKDQRNDWTRTTYLMGYFPEDGQWKSIESFAGTRGEDDRRLLFRGIIPYIRSWKQH